MKKIKLTFLTVVIVFLLQSCNNRGRDEQACITGNCAGTRCFESTGSTCSTIHNCEPITDGCTGDRLTGDDIEASASEHADKLLRKGFIGRENVEDVKELVRKILVRTDKDDKNIVK
jgi:hypothetical protein